MVLLWGLLLSLPSLLLSQSLYGVNQLDSYNRIIQSNNLGGLGLLQDAILKGKVHDVKSEVLGTPKLSGLPPLPEHAVQRGTPILDSDALAPPRRAVHRPVSRVEQHPSSTASPNMWGVNPIPELPPRHESKLGGYYDEDGEFHEFEKKKEKKRRVNEEEEDDETPHVITPIVRIDDSPHPISSSRRVSVQPAATPQKQRDPTAASLERRVRRVREQQHKAVARQASTPPASTPPPFQYRPKPKPFDRAPEDNNLLAEVEEYDDWLDQREAYQALFPGRRVANPYEAVPPGSVLFENVPPRPDPAQQQQLQRSAQQPGQFAPPPPPLNPQFNPAGPFPLGVPNPGPFQQFPAQFPTLNNNLFPGNPNLNPNAP
ncbi:hypothetical protein PFISCL1PPCAC_23411, partial [Pristionchus fissidentatus]